ncbi:general odorant-binding protein 83a-like [Achroia grisella]|uniref:general odorant-binding protein 83a-like n=1 Tax=Achroia grisella TaxID=688607 RepID=UPI0027D307B6|nr:general odorant-binding protein 83a-like [Achroia grisella]
MFVVTLSILLIFTSVGYGEKHKPVFSDEIKEIMEIVHNECVTKTKVAEEDITNCENGIFKDDVKLKCYLFCVVEELNLVDDDGQVDYDMLVSLIPEEYRQRSTVMIDGCKHLDTNNKDNCQKAFDVHKCSYAIDPDFYFIF